MAWVAILDKNAASIGWQYDNAAPGGTAGVRTNPRGVEIYIRTRMVGDPDGDFTRGEINKTFWDNHDKDTVRAWP